MSYPNMLSAVVVLKLNDIPARGIWHIAWLDSWDSPEFTDLQIDIYQLYVNLDIIILRYIKDYTSVKGKNDKSFCEGLSI